MWGFERVASGAEKGAYKHKHFIRDQESMCNNMIRQKVKGKRVVDQSSIPSIPKQPEASRSAKSESERCSAQINWTEVGQPNPVTARSCEIGDSGEFAKWQDLSEFLNPRAERCNKDLLKILLESSSSSLSASAQIDFFNQELQISKNKRSPDDNRVRGTSSTGGPTSLHGLEGTAKRRRSSLHAVFFDNELFFDNEHNESLTHGCGIEKESNLIYQFDTTKISSPFIEEERSLYRRRRSSMHATLLESYNAGRTEGGYLDLSDFEGRRFYVVHDYNQTSRDP